MQVIEKTPEKLVLRLDANLPLLNAIRRAASEVPTLAIDEVEIFKNDSALYDEVLAHRIGLIPLKTEKSMSSKTKIQLKLSKSGPGTVYAEDIEGPAEIPFGKIPITILGKNHKLELTATAVLGFGSEHAKYSPGIIYYRHLLEVKSSPQIDKVIQNAKTIIKPEKKGSKWLCDLKDADVKEIDDIDKDAVSDSEEVLLFVESFGMMKAEDIFKGALTALAENLDAFEKEIK